MTYPRRGWVTRRGRRRSRGGTRNGVSSPAGRRGRETRDVHLSRAPPAPGTPSHPTGIDHVFLLPAASLPRLCARTHPPTYIYIYICKYVRSSSPLSSHSTSRPSHPFVPRGKPCLLHTLPAAQIVRSEKYRDLGENLGEGESKEKEGGIFLKNRTKFRRIFVRERQDKF